MSIIGALLQQWRKPSGLMGRLAVWSMNKSHAPLADWGLAQVPIEQDWIILDVGCGGGMAAKKMAGKVPGGKVYAVDPSEASVLQFRRTNRDLIQGGQVEVKKASVSSLPYPDGMFDLVTASDSHYYWPDLASDLREVQRVLRPGGTVAIVGEGNRGGTFGRFYKVWMREAMVTLTSPQALVEQLLLVGFAEPHTIIQGKTKWMCVVASKP